MVSKVDLAIIFTAIAGAMIMIEHGHRLVVEIPAQADLAKPETVAACPDSDDQPSTHAASRSSRARTGVQRRIARQASVTLAFCPATGKVPYNASCLAFLTGATETGIAVAD